MKILLLYRRITIFACPGLQILLMLLILMTSCKNESSQSTTSLPSDSRQITKEGMTIFLPVGWKLQAENIGQGINMYSAENKNGGTITYYKVDKGFVQLGDEFVSSTSEGLIENIQSMTSSLAISGGLKTSSRSIKNKALKGKKELISVRELLPPRNSYYMSLEYYQIEQSEKIISIIIMGEDGTSDMSDIELIMNNFEIK